MKEQGKQNHKPAGKRRKSDEIKRLLQAFHKSQVITVEQFCEQHGIAKATFYKWQSRYHPLGENPQKAKDFVSIKLSDTRPVAQQQPTLFAEVNGIRLYCVVEPSYLKALLHE